MLQDDQLCRHHVDALEVMPRERCDEPRVGVVQCRDCGAELRIWVGEMPPERATRSA